VEFFRSAFGAYMRAEYAFNRHSCVQQLTSIHLDQIKKGLVWLRGSVKPGFEAPHHVAPYLIAAATDCRAYCRSEVNWRTVKFLTQASNCLDSNRVGAPAPAGMNGRHSLAPGIHDQNRYTVRCPDGEEDARPVRNQCVALPQNAFPCPYGNHHIRMGLL
jgi:hypothetical protein